MSSIIHNRLSIIILCVFFITGCNQAISYKRPQLLAQYGSFDCITSRLANKSYSRVWDKMVSGFCLDTIYSQRVNKEIEWFVNNKAFLYRSITRAKPFLYHILKELERNNLPFELALLPIVESGYQPYAYSPSRAAGIWQFIPPTAKEYGLSRNWWYDGRRDIMQSTKAAAHFLKDMHRHFDKNWLLAIASYNTGAGKVGRSIRKAGVLNGKPSFWDLNLPRETELYVPKLLALRDIISNPSSYGIKLPNIKNKPYTNLVNIEYPIDFYTFSILSNVSEKELYALNPGFNTWYFLPTFQDGVFLPSNKIKDFKKRYKKVTKFIFSKKTHLIVKGDSLSRISRKYNVSIKAIKKVNNLKSNVIILGKKLKLPRNTALSDVDSIKIDGKKYIISQKDFKYNHTVKRYDNWYKIAKMYNISLSQLLKWNKATKKTPLKVSGKVIIMMKTPILSLTNEVKLRYVVNSGDTTAIVSTGFGVSKKKLMKTNQIKNSKYLTAGKNLTIILK